MRDPSFSVRSIRSENTLQVEYRFTLLSRGFKRCHRLGDLLCTHKCCPFVSLDELDKLVQHAEAARVADELDVQRQMEICSGFLVEARKFIPPYLEGSRVR